MLTKGENGLFCVNCLSRICYRYGTPDPDVMREYDVRVKLTMSSVWYVHTQHFMQETFAFIQNFNKLQDILGRSRAVASGKKVNIICASYEIVYACQQYVVHFYLCPTGIFLKHIRYVICCFETES